ncbi:SGNH/GDSL hydrolase family protein [Devosia sp. 2618]|uniref:SGNH/GDSL hydrolase family protein n=1 Tax=Devosia sp. 2618 TaxID=3156454 RepID=UPI00339B5431
MSTISMPGVALNEALPGYGPVEIATIGDSNFRAMFTLAPNGAVGQNTFMQGAGPASHVQSRLRGRARFSADLCFAQNGATIANLVTSQIPALLQSRQKALQTRVVMLMIGTNNASGWTNATTQAADKAALLSGIKDLLAAGWQVLVLTGTARGTTYFTGVRLTGASLSLWHDYNHWLVSHVGLLPGVRVVDLFAQSAMPNSAEGDMNPGYTVDGLHLNAKFWHDVSGQIAAELEPWLGSPRYRTAVGASDTYHATNNPAGNLSSNALATGSDGTVPAGYAGTLPTGWTIESYGMSGINQILSIVTDAEGTRWVQLTLSGTTSTGSQIVQIRPPQDHAPLGSAGGDLIQLIALAEIAPGFTGIENFDFHCGAGSPNGGDDGLIEFGSGGELPAGDYTGANALFAITPDCRVPPNSWGLVCGWRITCKPSSSVSLTVRLGRPAIRRANVY